MYIKEGKINKAKREQPKASQREIIKIRKNLIWKKKRSYNGFLAGKDVKRKTTGSYPGKNRKIKIMLAGLKNILR